MADAQRSDIKRILPLVFGITLLGFIDTQMIVPIMRLYADGLGATAAFAGFIIGMYSIINTPANVVFGSLVDKFGRKTPLIIGLVGDAICMFLYTLCGTPQQLLFIRAAHGLTGAVLGLTTASLIADYAPVEKRGRCMGFYGIAMGLAPLIGMMITGIIARNCLGFDMVFYTGGVLLLAAVVLASLLPSAEVKGGTGGIDFKRIGAVSRRKPNIASYATIFSLWFVFGGITVALPGYMTSLGMEAFHVSMVMVAITAATIVSMYPVGALSDRMGRKIPSIAGLILLTVGVNLIPAATSFEKLIAAGILLGIGEGAIIPSILAIISDNTERGERGTAMGIFNALLTLGVAVGAPVIGVLASIFGESPAMHLSSLLPVACIFVVLNFVKPSISD